MSERKIRVSYPAPQGKGIYDAFNKPDLDSLPMARMWFPDAAAGAVDDDIIQYQLSSMARGGIGGVEIALLGDDTGNMDGVNFGWGSPNWVKTMNKIMDAAARIEGGFKVDFTITAHWPPIVNTIDPNDSAASSNLVYTMHQLTAEDIAAGKIVLELPELRKYDTGRNPFLFLEQLAGVCLLKDSGITPPKPEPMGMPMMMDQSGLHHFGPERTMFEGKATGAPGGSGMPFPPMEAPEPKPIYALDSLTDVTANVFDTGDSFRVGVPDAEALEKYYGGEETLEKVLDVFGPEPDMNALLADGKRDKDLNRVRMADVQHIWGLNLPDTAVEGDFVMACYIEGTGQIFSGGFKSRLMKNMTYAANYFTLSGTHAITDYWDNYILSDAALRSKMEKNGKAVGGSIFEDSIELHSNGAHWGVEFKADMDKYLGYDCVKYFPVYCGLDFDDKAQVERIKEDYNHALGEMYQYNHIGELCRWTKTFNYTYRAQAGMAGINMTGANASTDITEGDNGTFKDSNRRLAACVNMVPTKKFHSFESNTFTGFSFPWSLLVQECNYDASNGTNRVIFHGTPYAKNGSNFYDWWPGWNWGGGGSHAHDFMAWDERICWWDDSHVIVGYLSRLQSLLQNVQAKVDLAVFEGVSTSIMRDTGHKLLPDLGYSYNILDSYLLSLPTATVSNGKLYEAGPAYRALVVTNAQSLYLATARKMLELAKAGLPIFFEGQLPCRITGTELGDNTDAALMAVLDELYALPNVSKSADEAELVKALADADILPAAAYSCANLEASHLSDGQGDCFLFYNDNTEKITTTVTLNGQGGVTELELWGGSVSPMPSEVVDGKTVFTLELEPQDMAAFYLGGENTASNQTLTEAGSVKVAKWDTVDVTSFGPLMPGDEGYEKNNPIKSLKTVVSFKDVPAHAACWEQLPASEEQLKELRIGAMADVSGSAVYSGVFTLPEDTKGAVLRYDHGDLDWIVSVTCNGKKIGDVNCMKNTITLDGAAVPGENSLVIKVDSTLLNRLNYESFFKFQTEDFSHFSFGGGARDVSIRHSTGLKEVEIVAYK